MARFAVQCLADRGYEPVLAYYAPYSAYPALSVPSFKLLQRGVGAQSTVTPEGREAHALGAWLPELEFTHYAATRHWKALMDTCEAFVSVCGNVLAATPFLQTQRPFVAWVATDWEGDRKERVKGFPLARRWLDSYFNRHVITRLESRLLSSGTILSLSEATAAVLADAAGSNFRKQLLPVPVNTDLFVADPSATVTGHLGFAGRFTDPRKNIGLLLQSVATLRNEGHGVTLTLMGDNAGPDVAAAVQALGIESAVTFASELSREKMAAVMQTLDVFVLPSHQEGLCISALEAMACGVPVVSTRCGGPEEFVIPNETGLLVDAQPAEMSHAIASIISDRTQRARMSKAAQAIVEARYTRKQAEATLIDAISTTFPGMIH